ncbi:hypothetical protein MMA231_03553 (plasmid) [Asticcacaulis sp. MM231]|uniref:peptidylprolyl isomerase n=1 Tax=Asticcacaulis sp. MM231 TaxID=3157666 RepID=UPI0032D58028
MYNALLLAVICLLPSVGLAQTHESAVTTSVVAPATVSVSIETTAGPIVLALEAERAPLTTANFLAYVDQHKLDGTVFYRAMMDWTASLIKSDIYTDAGAIWVQ